MDGHKQNITNYKIEPPALFRGRGDHPNLGRVKRRILAKDITINIEKGSKVPEPPGGEESPNTTSFQFDMFYTRGKTLR